MWPYGRQNRQNSHFWYKSPQIEKLEYRCTTRNLPLCNGTIIVLKITLVHGVSVITNFVIPKRDIKNKTKKKHHTFWSTAGAWPTIPTTILGMVIEEVRPIFVPPNFFDPISSFGARGYRNFGGKCPHRGKMLITCPSKVTKLKTSKLPIDAYKRWEFPKNIANESPLSYKFLAKIPNFDSFGGCIPTFLPL